MSGFLREASPSTRVVLACAALAQVTAAPKHVVCDGSSNLALRLGGKTATPQTRVAIATAIARRAESLFVVGTSALECAAAISIAARTIHRSFTIAAANAALGLGVLHGPTSRRRRRLLVHNTQQHFAWFHPP